MRIQNNVTAVNSHRNYNNNVTVIGKDMEKLSSGYRVNRAADDAAGLAISEKMRTQIRGLSMASRNTQDGISLLQVADGAMQIAHGILQRMRELAAQSANGTNDDEIDRNALNLEYQQLIQELDQLADTTNFNGVYPLKGANVPPVKNTTLTEATVSSPSISVQDFPVNTAGAVPFPGSVSAPNLTYATPGTYSINANDLTGVTNINLGAGVNLVITGDLTGPLNFIGSGNAYINGNVTGDVNNMNSNSRLQITGNVTGTVNNFGQMKIGPATVPVTTFTGKINNMGSMSFNHRGVATAGNETFTYNNGYLIVTGNTVGIKENDTEGKIRFEPGTGHLVDNKGLVEVKGIGNIVTMRDNNGTILVESGAELRGSGSTNYGRIDIAAGGYMALDENTASGKVLCYGTMDVADNYGFLQLGKWDGDATTPANGSSEGLSIVGLNAGTVRNFSQALYLFNNTGEIDNYGTISVTQQNGDLRHHARRPDASGVTADRNVAQSITFVVNGVPQTLNGMWNAVAGGYELEFTAPTTSDGGQAVFTAFPNFRSGTIAFSILDNIIIPNSSGTSGLSLSYFMEEPFVIQSGANEGDATFLSFRALNAMNLGIEAVSPHGECLFDNIGESHIRTMDAASCALTLTLKAINDVSIYRAELGAQYNRLEYKYDNLNNSTENLSAAESRIRDADMAKQMTFFTKNNILIQSSTAMLAQANALPQGVLQLLG